MTTRRAHAAALAVILAAGCARQTNPGTVLEIAGRTNGHVTLASARGSVAAVWAVSGSPGSDIYFASSSDGGRHFGAPVRVNDVSGEASVSGEQPPRVVMRGSTAHVVWVAKLDGISAIRASESRDGGVTFSPARTITPAGINGARGWESAALGDEGVLHIAWLDGRAAAPQGDRAQTAGHHHDHGSAPRQDVFHATWTGVAETMETRVAANVCFCCKTAIATRGSDVYVAWRHLFDGGVRDIAVAHSADGGRTFGPPVRVSLDEWKIDACPDDGPAMALDSRGRLHVVWPTLVHDPDRARMAIFHSVSEDGGTSFSARERMDGERRTDPSHPRVAASADGGVAIVWDELVDGRRQVAARAIASRAGDVRILSHGKPSSYPVISLTDAGYLVAWTEQESSRSFVTLIGF